MVRVKGISASSGLVQDLRRYQYLAALEPTREVRQQSLLRSIFLEMKADVKVLCRKIGETLLSKMAQGSYVTMIWCVDVDGETAQAKFSVVDARIDGRIDLGDEPLPAGSKTVVYDQTLVRLELVEMMKAVEGAPVEEPVPLLSESEIRSMTRQFRWKGPFLQGGAPGLGKRA